MCFKSSKTNPAQGKQFNPGDRVEVKWSPMWDGFGTVTRITSLGDVVVELDKGIEGGFPSKNLTLIETPAPAKKQFKPGDRVNVFWVKDSVWSGPATVRKIYSPDNISVNTDSGYTGAFASRNLTLIETPASAPVPATVFRTAIDGISGASEGMDSRSKVYQIAKDLAVTIAKQRVTKTTTVDQVQTELAKLGYKSTDLGNAAGALFRGKNWEWYGYRKSERKGNHARKVSVWQYVGV